METGQEGEIPPREFTINDHLCVRLEGTKTVIYVAGKAFRQCKALMLNVPRNAIWASGKVSTIDEAAELFASSENSVTGPPPIISPEVEFWGHCSNLQAWADAGYDTRLLHRNIAFPLLKELAESGDVQARDALAREVAARLASGHPATVAYLIEEGYPAFLRPSDLAGIPSMVLATLLPAVENLNLSHNPAGINLLSQVHFTQLKCRTLSGNELTEVPAAIEGLGSLLTLNLSHNALTRIAPFLGRLKSLEWLDLGHNQLRVIPETIGELHSLKVLHLDRNEVAILPDFFADLHSLEQLFLRNNALASLPPSIGSLGKLKQLDLQYNQLTALPETINGLQSLVKFKASTNALERLPDAICDLSSLVELHVRGNRLTCLPEGTGIMRALRWLDLGDNELANLPPSLDQMHLRILNLEGNPLEQFLRDAPQALNHLQERGCAISF